MPRVQVRWEVDHEVEWSWSDFDDVTEEEKQDRSVIEEIANMIMWSEQNGWTDLHEEYEVIENGV